MKLTVEQINEAIKNLTETEKDQVSDGYHTIKELYDHRIRLFIEYLKLRYKSDKHFKISSEIWKSLSHSDGSKYEGWFILGIYKEKGFQISYHLPINYWEECYFADTLEQAPEFDGHTSEQVLERLKSL